MAQQTLQLDRAVIKWAVNGLQTSEQHAMAALAAGQPLLVLMHGLGSNENDLIQLVDKLPATFVCASVRAVLDSYGDSGGYSWFPLSLQPGGVEPDDSEGTALVAARAVIEWIDSLRTTLESIGGKLDTVALMGFSQGGVMVTTMLRERPTEYLAGVNCSGFISPGEFAGDARLREIKPPLFWGRDPLDPVIGHGAIKITSAWSPAHTTLTERHYDGIAHSICAAELQDISDFLTAELAK
ncbi:esterase [Canibacter sp. lx-72]|uniref:alpha/beta hydrolase n=1 Tax=Canibacter zhuwentaonis TaxID=2837491 RepID=UPI001BDBE200|nr:esterase [Canibacter zhuwentaonis]MBT1018424.1 esterase [Canibacter zhuwentaonis]